MNAKRSKINGQKPRNNPSERGSFVLIEWTNRIIMARPRKIAASIVHAAIPFVDGEKSHWQFPLEDACRQFVQSQLVFAGYRLGKHVSSL